MQKKLQFVATKFKNSNNLLIIRLIRLSVLELQPLTTMVIFKSTRLYDKKDDFSFVIIHFPPLDNNIPATPEYGNYITFEPAVLIQSFNNITVFFLLNYYVDNSNKIILILSFKWFFERYQLHTERYFPSYTRMTRDCAGSKLTTISLLFLSIAFCATGG